MPVENSQTVRLQDVQLGIRTSIIWIYSTVHVFCFDVVYTLLLVCECPQLITMASQTQPMSRPCKH